MIARILLVAIAAGVIAGTFVTAAQSFKVIPLIYQAETYENAASEKAAAPPVAADWAPQAGFERVAYTLATNVLNGVGFGFLLTAVIVFAGLGISWSTGILWGVGGFLAFSFIPAIGLAPEMPGMVAADIVDRQIWWAGAVVSALIGMGLLAFGKGAAFKVLGLVILAIPQVVGAPHVNLAEVSSSVPAELAAQYVVATLLTTGLFWMVLGASVGGLLQRYGNDNTA
jgi:cobalt transporter subunit CbtA